MNKADKLLATKMVQLGCIVCKVYGIPNYPNVTGYRTPEIHHITTNSGMGRKNAQFIPLCPQHHRYGGHGIAFHMGAKSFEQNFDTQQNLHQLTLQLLETLI